MQAIVHRKNRTFKWQKDIFVFVTPDFVEVEAYSIIIEGYRFILHVILM
jgi:hypothetical protein